MMERLTMWTQKGASLKLDNPHSDEEARENLMSKYLLAVNKLAKYEDAEEQGLLLRLPCKVGDTVYKLGYPVRLDKKGNFKTTTAWKEVYESKFECSMVEDFSKTIFLTREEAEKALEGEGNESI